VRRFLDTRWGKYAIALVAVAVALGIRGLIDPLVGRGAATVTLYGAIAVAVWAGGYKPGILAALVGYLGVNWFFMEPRGSVSIENLADVGRFIGFMLSAALIIALGGAMHAARQRTEREAELARRHAEDLEREVEGHRQTRASLEAKEHDLHTVTDTMSAAVARCSADLRYLWVNRLYAEWVGHRKPEEMIGRPMFEVLGLEAVEQIRPHIDHVLAGNRVEYERFARRPLLGRRRWIHVTLDPIFEEAFSDAAPHVARKVTGWVSVIHDIDETKRAVEAERDAQEQLQVITDTMSAAVARTGNDLRFLWMNPVYARWVGRPAKQLVGQAIADVLGPEQMRDIAPHIARVLKGESVQYERLANLPGLGERWISCIYTPVLDATGHPDGWVTIATDVHDRKLTEDSLKAADRRKDDFLATLAHELRNPLAPIRNAVAILGRKGSLDPELAWSREVIVRQVEQMSRLIDDLLDIERISRGKFLVRKERLPLERAIDMALEMSRPYITSAGHRLSVLMPSERVMLDADPARLAQVFSNLLNNAAKFTEPRGEITLSAQVEGNAVVVKVEDNGIGFPPEVASRLFKPYAQLTSTQDRARGGLGIGLSLVQGIVNLHGGKVEAKSDGPGRGAEFSVQLPLAAVGARVPEGATPRDAERAPTQGLRILVADDNRDAADSLQRVLELYGHEVKVAYDGENALEVEKGFQPEIAVLDIGMPGASGYEVARAMRARRGGSITLVALTGWGQEGDRRRAIEAGFDYHLTKPVDPGVLNDLVGEVASRTEKNKTGV
jgi:PAS domain S-box-containing protein